MATLSSSLFLACFVTFPTAIAIAQSDGAPGGVISSDNKASKVDNSRLNIRDKNLGEVTVDKNPSAKRDGAITKSIRAALAKDGALKSIKVATLSGVVELVGTVKTQAEKDSAESTAKSTAGVVKVKNEIAVQ